MDAIYRSSAKCKNTRAAATRTSREHYQCWFCHYMLGTLQCHPNRRTKNLPPEEQRSDIQNSRWKHATQTYSDWNNFSVLLVTRIEYVHKLHGWRTTSYIHNCSSVASTLIAIFMPNSAIATGHSHSDASSVWRIRDSRGRPTAALKKKSSFRHAQQKHYLAKVSCFGHTIGCKIRRYK